MTLQSLYSVQDIRHQRTEMSVRLSIARRYYVDVSSTFFHHLYDSPIILVFREPNRVQKFRKNHS